MIFTFGSGFIATEGRNPVVFFGMGELILASRALKAQWTGSQIGELNIYQDFEAQVDVEQRALSTGEWEDAPGLTDLEVRIAATPNGAAIVASVAASERTGTPARYYSGFDTGDLVSALNNATYLNKKVYVVLSKSGDLDGLWWSFWVRGNREGF